MSETIVVNIRKYEGEYVYIGRAGHGQDGYFGNPFSIGIHGDREEVMRRFKRYFWERVNDDPEYRRRIMALRGKVLGCFCRPLACHGDVIVDWLNAGCPLREK